MTGLVVLVATGLRLPADRSLGRGVQLTLGRRNDLRKHLHQVATHPKRWSADDVVAAGKALQMTEFVPSYRELVDTTHGGGFGELLAARPREYTPPANKREQPRKPAPSATPPPPPRPNAAASSPRSATTARPHRPSTPRPPRGQSPATSRPRPPRGLGAWVLPIVLLILFVTATIVTAIVVRGAFH